MLVLPPTLQNTDKAHHYDTMPGNDLYNQCWRLGACWGLAAGLATLQPETNEIGQQRHHQQAQQNDGNQRVPDRVIVWGRGRCPLIARGAGGPWSASA